MGWGDGGCIRGREEGGGGMHMVWGDGGVRRKEGGGLEVHLLCKTTRQPHTHTDNTLPTHTFLLQCN